MFHSWDYAITTINPVTCNETVTHSINWAIIQCVPVSDADMADK